MRSATIVILHAFVVPNLAKEQEVNHTKADTLVEKVMDSLSDKLVNKLFGKVVSSSLRTGDFTQKIPDWRAGLASPIVVSSSVGLSATRGQTRSLSSQDKKHLLAALPGPAAWKNSVISAMKSKNGRCLVRDTSVKAAAADSPPVWSLGLDGAGEEPLSKQQVEEMAGITAPLGLFDPLGIATNVPEGRLLFYREAELKHGRVCMLAMLGLIVGDRHDFIPFFNQGIPTEKAAWVFGTPYLQETTAASFWSAALLAIFAEEWRRVFLAKENIFAMAHPPEPFAPGDYGWDPLGLKPKDATAFKELQSKELNNGRLAMFAAAGWIAQEQMTNGKIWPFS